MTSPGGVDTAHDGGPPKIPAPAITSQPLPPFFFSDGVSFWGEGININQSLPGMTIARYDTLDVTSSPKDPEVICALDVKSAYQGTDRRLTLDVLNNEATRDYAAGFRKGQPFTSSEDMGAISNLFLYWYSLRMVYSKKRYFDNLAKAHSIAQWALYSQRYRIANFALQRTFRFTPLGLAFCFFPFSNTHTARTPE